MLKLVVKIAEFQKVYPKLFEKINEARIESGSKPIHEEYTEHFIVPIRMYDAALAESFLEKNNKCDNPQLILGFKQTEKILNAVVSEPNMLRWLDILYYPNNPKGLYSDRYNQELKIKKPKQKEPTMAKIRNQVENEIIVNVNAQGETYIATLADGTDRTADISQKKLKYAFINKGVIRGRALADGTIKWRVVKEKFIIKNEQPVNEQAPVIIV